MKHCLDFFSDFSLICEWIFYEVTHPPSQTSDALFGFWPWHIFTRPGSHRPSNTPPKPGSSSAGIPSEGLAGTRVPTVANTNPTQPWTSHQVVLELRADALWPCFSAVASFPGTLEALGDANQVRSCLLWACLLTFWIALSYRRFLF